MMPLPEHWQYAALGAFSMTPILGVLWSTARGWRVKAISTELHLKAAQECSEIERGISKSERKAASTLADQVIELTIKLDDERAVTADQSDRLTEIIKRGKTQKPNSTVKAMVRIAEGG